MLMKRTALALTLISALLVSALAGSQFVNVGIANPVPPTTEIQILSPQSDKTYSAHKVPLIFEVVERHGTYSFLIGTSLILYYVDGEEAGYFDGSEFSGNGLSKTFSVNLTGLSAGRHSVKITKNATFNLIMTDYTQFVSSREVYFWVTTSLRISVILPENKTYNTDSLPLTVITNEPVLWMGYSLDGKANLTIRGNTTLNGLESGLHNITVYATDVYREVWASETVYFNLTQESETPPEPFPTVMVAASTALAVTIGASIAFYFTRVRRAKENQEQERAQP